MRYLRFPFARPAAFQLFTSLKGRSDGEDLMTLNGCMFCFEHGGATRNLGEDMFGFQIHGMISI